MTHYQEKFTQPSFINLVSSQARQVPKHLFTAKISFKPQRYLELDVFREQITQSRAGLHHQPYSSNKQTVLIYKTIFFSLAALFGILGITTIAVPLTIITGFFNYYTALKGLIVSFCAFFSISSFTLAMAIRTEKEAVLHCVRKARTYLASVYARKCLRTGIKRFFAFLGPQRQNAQALKSMFHEANDKINEKKDETLHLVQRIVSARTLEAAEKEALLNQAIEELDDKLMLLVHSFRHALPRK